MCSSLTTVYIEDTSDGIFCNQTLMKNASASHVVHLLQLLLYTMEPLYNGHFGREKKFVIQRFPLSRSY